ncbi:MAG: hypothetical protein ACKPGT_28880 [Microcystis sp.]
MKTIFPENYPYSSPFHTETRRANVFFITVALPVFPEDNITQTQLCQVAGFVQTFFLLPAFHFSPKIFCSRKLADK